MQSQPKLKDLLYLFFPIFLTLVAPASFFFIQKIFFSRLQPGVMEAGLNVIYALRTFQMPCVLLAMMAQVSVAQLYGAQNLQSIGRTTWQFIWFAFLSNLIVIPASILYWKLYFQGTAMEPIAAPYYRWLVGINWLYPLGSALSCFYLGQGHTRVVVLGKIATEFLTLVLAYILIFGNGWIPALGLVGGAIATGISQFLYCAVLMILFLQKSHATLHGSHHYLFQSKLFWDSIRPGVLRALANLSTFACWATIWKLIVDKAGINLRLITIGGVLFVFLSCFGEALCQSLTIMVSQLIGAKRYELLGKTLLYGTSLAIGLATMMGVPLFLCPNFIIEQLFSFATPDSYATYAVMIGVWLSLFLGILCSTLLSYILAFKDMQAILIFGVSCWGIGFLWTYFAFHVLDLSPLHFWSVTSVTFLFNFLLYVWRVKKLIIQNKQELNSIVD